MQVKVENQDGLGPFGSRGGRWAYVGGSRRPPSQIQKIPHFGYHSCKDRWPKRGGGELDFLFLFSKL
jgi:hypothetical protein